MSITALTVVTAATEQALTVSEAKSHLRITHDFEDQYIAEITNAAVDWASDYMRRKLLDTQVTVQMDQFPDRGEQYYIGYSDAAFYDLTTKKFSRNLDRATRDRSIFLPGGRVTAVNEIRYTDADDVLQTLTGATSTVPGTDYQEDLTDDEWPMVYPAIESDWPSTKSGKINAVVIDYQVGWATALDIPQGIRQAIRFKMADMFTMRDNADAGGKSQLLKAAENLLDPYVVTLV